MEIDWELTEKSAKFIHHGECESWYMRVIVIVVRFISYVYVVIIY